MKQNLALFDLDNTLLAGDSDHSWSTFLIGEGLLDEKTRDRNKQFHQDYQSGTLDVYAFLKFRLQVLAEHPKAFLDELLQKYMGKVIRPMMTQKAQDLVNKHKANGDLCMVITATNSYVTRPIVTAYGIEHLIGTDLEMINGEFTGGVSGTPSFGQGKVIRLNEWLAAKGQTLADFETSYFYSDSHNDLPLMKLVTNPVAVDADSTLTTYASERGWAVISLRS